MERNIDELNTLFYKQYFDSMALTNKQKEDRIKAAKTFEEILLDYIVTVALENEFGAESTTKEVLMEEYADAVKEFIDDPDFVDVYTTTLLSFIEETTIKNKGQEYNTSYQRAMDLSANQASIVLNRDDFQKKSRAGCTRKQWITKSDEKVRFSHMKLDGEIIGIDDFFLTGEAIMRFPLDFEYASGHPEELNHCRCSIDYF